MKRMIIAALSFFFLFATAIPVISKDYNRDTHGRRDNKERPDNPSRPDYQNHRVNKKGSHDNRRNYKEQQRRNYRHHSRNYKYHDYNDRRHNYKGHYGSWNQWNSYARTHPDIYRHGTYYRENSHLMFRFCEPGTGNCFFFSIGR
ncbi:MAG TPA: hypothetical protein VMW06_06180 [Desulfobacterales bacterium]|nr:hypothetical protein [Desulfobacterales bacterium]